MTLTPERKSADGNVPFDHYVVAVENVSSKTVHGYSLGHICNCRGHGTYGPYPEGINFGNPQPAHRLLKPGESKTEVRFVGEQPVDQPKVWADLVHFTDGTNRGPNQRRTEGYVRALE